LNLQISAKLSNSIVTNDPALPLDGLLLKAALEKEFGTPLEAVLPDPKTRLVYPSEMPIETRNAGTPFWYYACSFAQYSLLGESTQHWHKRLRSQHEGRIDWREKRGKVDIGSGRFRGYRMPMQTFHIDMITWYAVGEASPVLSLVSPISYIGKKRAQGQGEILEWRVIETPHDHSEYKEGRRTRAIPIKDEGKLTPDTELAFRGFRPPYWHKDNMGWCFV
jgi:CRISPR type IV-associated protein Csf3